MPTLSKARYTSSLPRLIRYCSQKSQTQNMLTPKHAGFVHTIFLISRSDLLIVYNCPPPSAANWSTRDDSLHLDLFAHSLNTPKPLSTWLHVFSYGYWLETELQMILLVLGIYFIVSLCEALQICSVYGFYLQTHHSRCIHGNSQYSYF